MSPEILVTGGSGILGSYVIRHLHDLGFHAITATYQADLATIPQTLRHAATWHPLVLPDRQAALDIVAGKQWIIHAAGHVSYLHRDRHKLLEINRQGTSDLVDAAILQGARHFVYIGSIAALGKDPDQPILDENTGWIDNDFSTPYGLSKYLGELEVWRGAAEGLPVSVVLPAIILGTGRTGQSSMRLLQQAGRKPGWAPGGSSGFVDVRDVATFIGLLLQQENEGGRWLLSAGELGFAELFKRMAALLHPDNSYRVAPRWLMNLVYCYVNALSGNGLSQALINQAYSHFRYNAAKSLTLPGFAYRPLDHTLAELAAYLKTGQPIGLLLP